MKTKFVLSKTVEEPVQELLLTLEKYGTNDATIMLTLPSGTKVPLVGVQTHNGKLGSVRWSVFEDETSEHSQYVILHKNSGRTMDLFND